MIAGYLIAVNELKGSLYEQDILQEAYDRLDGVRRRRIDEMKQPQDKLRSAGAGMLLQYALRQHIAKQYTPQQYTLQQYTPQQYTLEPDVWLQPIWSFLDWEELFRQVKEPVELTFCYGQYGKPYLTGIWKDIFFSLSHSGEYALCVISDSEVGADIQQRRSINFLPLARRFFTDKEKNTLTALSKEEQEEFFFRLWTRKEAYGKMTGMGMKEGLLQDVGDALELPWIEYDGLKDYNIAAICHKRK